MRTLFGVDFAAEIDNAMQSANSDTAGVPVQTTGYGTVTFTKLVATTRTPGSETAGLNPTPTPYPGVRAKVEDMPVAFIGRPLGELAVEPGDARVTVYTASIPQGADGEPVAVPEIDDEITIGGRARKVYFVKRGTSSATFTCFVR